jgi:hypothetical protein
MNYIVEDDFDFYGELNNVQELNTSDTVPSTVPSTMPSAAPSTVPSALPTTETIPAICMISHEPLTYNAIILPCKHSFNYLPLYNELCLHNNKEYIICPYCRTKSDKLIPFISLPNVTKIVGVNYPTKLCMPKPKCSLILKTGMYKGLPCEHNGIEYEHGTFCSKHEKYNIDNVWTPEKEKFIKEKNIPEIKSLLRSKGLKVGGVKKELVNRWFAGIKTNTIK